jgi:Family of unknown function (DUF6510)
LSFVLDGNAIAGQLFEVFGAETTTDVGRCGACGNVALVGELAVYLGLGTVVRCRRCDNLLMAFVSIRGTTCVDLSGLAALEHDETAF